MSITYLQPRKYYENRYDHITVEHGRSEMKWFIQAYEEFFKKYQVKLIPLTKLKKELDNISAVR